MDALRSQFESSMYVFKAAALQGVKKLFDTKVTSMLCMFHGLYMVLIACYDLNF